MSGIKWLWTFPHTAWAASAISISNSRPRLARFSQASGFLFISSGEESLCNGRRLYPHESPAPLARLARRHFALGRRSWHFCAVVSFPAARTAQRFTPPSPPRAVVFRAGRLSRGPCRRGRQMAADVERGVRRPELP